MNSIKTKHNWHPNTSIDFTDSNVILRVSLNVTASVARKLSQNNIQKGKKHIVYALKIRIPNEMVCRNTMETAQKLLLSNCMSNIRKAKQND